MYFTDLGEINFPLKIDFRIKCHVETDLKKLFESKNCLTPLIQFLPLSMLKLFLQKCQQILLDKNFRHYLETTMVSKKIMHIGVQKTPIQKTYEIAAGSNSINIDLLGSDTQFDWPEISLLFDKSKKYTSLYLS